MTSFERKVVALTGGASGIGLETAKLLAKRGARLSIADGQEKALEEASVAIKAASPTAEVMTSIVDVRGAVACNNWIAETVTRFGGLDYAANIAGAFKSTSLSKEDGTTWEFILTVNLTGVMNCMKAQLPHIKSGGAIVNSICSWYHG